MYERTVYDIHHSKISSTAHQKLNVACEGVSSADLNGEKKNKKTKIYIHIYIFICVCVK